MIRSDPSILMGKPVIAGTRLTVELILEKLGAGETIDQLLQSYPRRALAEFLAVLYRFTLEITPHGTARARDWHCRYWHERGGAAAEGIRLGGDR